MATQRAPTEERDRSSMTDLERRNDHHMLESPLQKKMQQGKKTPSKKSMSPPALTDNTKEGVESDDECVQEEAGEDEDSDDEADAVVPVKASEHAQTEEHDWADMQSADLEEGSDAEANVEEADFERTVDDDDYGGLDDMMSVSSAGSHQFEEEVEEDIRVNGVDDIDWDDEETYQYNETSVIGSYGFDYGLPMDPLMMLEVFSPAEEEHIYVAQDVDDAVMASQHDDLARSQVVFGNVWPVMSDSENENDNEDAQSEKTIGDPERRASHGSDTSGLTSLNESGYETDEEEMPEPVISSPSTHLVKTPRKNKTSSISRIITPYTPRRSGLKPTTITRMPFRSGKPIASTVRTPYGRVLHVQQPKGCTLEWVKLPKRHQSESSDDSPASPTMVNLNEALLEGNTRTGAHISDVINGRLFAQYHCTQLQLPDPMDELEDSFAEFARIPGLMNGLRTMYGYSGDLFEEEDEQMPLQETMHAFIDFEGGVTDGDPSTPNPTPASRTSSFAGFVEEEEALSPAQLPEDSITAAAAPAAGPSFMIPPSPLTSKRRASGLPPATSPELKRARLDVPAVAVNE